MSKKKKRSRKRSSGGRIRASSQSRQQTVAPTPVPPGAASTKSAAIDFSSEYQYVLSDLKRFAVLAAAMFATLIVLALVIR